MASEESSEEFVARVGSILVNGFTSFGLSLGHEVGLFDVLADMKEPRTSQEIADAGNFKERYVREWLGAMVTAHIVELDSSGEKYFLPQNRASALTTKGLERDGVLSTTLLTSFGGSVYHQIKDCFKKDGPRGVPHSAYQSSFDALRRKTVVFLEKFPITSLLSPYPELTNLLEKGIKVADLGCGSGVTTIHLAKAYPRSNFCGVDLMEDCIKEATEEAGKLKLKNIRFQTGDDTDLPDDWRESFDFVFMNDTLHDQARPDRALKEIHRILVPGGIFMVFEPPGHSSVKDNLEKLKNMQRLYVISLFLCMPTSLHSEGGMGLGAVWGREKAVEMITAAGLEVSTVAENVGGGGQHFFCKKK